jgi:hypothetical protein
MCHTYWRSSSLKHEEDRHFVLKSLDRNSDRSCFDLSADKAVTSSDTNTPVASTLSLRSSTFLCSSIYHGKLTGRPMKAHASSLSFRSTKQTQSPSTFHYMTDDTTTCNHTRPRAERGSGRRILRSAQRFAFRLVCNHQCNHTRPRAERGSGRRILRSAQQFAFRLVCNHQWNDQMRNITEIR